MIVGQMVLPRKLAIPENIRQAGKCAELDTYRNEILFGAHVWMACAYAWPHTDDSWSHNMFLTLSVVSAHLICDSKETHGLAIPAGTFFVVDPRIRHWLQPADAWRLTKVSPWIGLQWELPRRNAAKQGAKIIRDLIAKHGGHQKGISTRYAKWRAQGK